MPEMSATMRPMKESTISSVEMSMSTPLLAFLLDGVRQVVLQLQRELIVHVDLDGDEQELAHPQDWNAFHRAASVA